MSTVPVRKCCGTCSYSWAAPGATPPGRSCHWLVTLVGARPVADPFEDCVTVEWVDDSDGADCPAWVTGASGVGP